MLVAAAAGIPVAAQMPPPGPVPANASQITARVLRDSVPVGEGVQVRLVILKAHPFKPGLESLIQPGQEVEAFAKSGRAIPVGKVIEATIELTGDTRGVRWWLSNFQYR